MGTNARNYFAGTFSQDGDKVFFDLKRREDAVVIVLQGEDFKRIIIGVEDVNATVEYIQKALAAK